MKIWHLVIREISHRRLNFLLALVSVAVAVGCVVGAETLLQVDRLETERILSERRQEVERAVAARQAEVEQAGAELQDAMRKSMKELGFNVLILPAEQDLAELHLDGTLSQTMPEQYAEKLANSNIVTVNHLLPSVTKRIRWEERGIDIVLYGTRGEVPLMHRSQKQPILQAVTPGQMVVGYEIHQRLGLKVGDAVRLNGRQFTVSKLHPQRGSTDDVTVWIDLAQAQELLGMQNLIHAILALECECAGDRITQVRSEIGGILPGTKVIERYSQALTRAEARGKAKESAEAALAREMQAGAEALQREVAARRQIEQQHTRLAAVLVPLAVLGAAVWVGLLAWGNARQRSAEIGILRAIGLRSRQIVAAFLTKAALIGICGGVLGSVGGIALGISSGQTMAPSELWRELLAGTAGPLAAALSLVLAPLLTAVASWLPALLVSRQDPAVVLQGE